MRTARQESELASAYCEAQYRATVAGAPVEFTFSRRGGGALAANQLPPGEWAIIAAANPWSRPLDDARNAARTLALRAELDAAHVRWTCARNSAPDGAWAEESLLVEGIGRDGALAIGRRYGQAAAVWGAGIKCGLLWTRSERWTVLGAQLPGATR
ncbi:MAG: DUF3293 domain-containing protein [Phycisphaeraceae bacterium]|nr:DUF3293 domain-containing protein [Phycisphaeraceae bacterium]